MEMPPPTPTPVYAIPPAIAPPLHPPPHWICRRPAQAGVVESVDTGDLKSPDRKVVRVRVPPSAPGRNARGHPRAGLAGAALRRSRYRSLTSNPESPPTSAIEH